MKKKTIRYKWILAGIFAMLSLGLTGCRSGEFLPVYVNEDCGKLKDERIETLQDRMYDAFISRRFIRVTDHEGNEQLIKVINEIGRNGYDMSAFTDTEEGFRIYNPNGVKTCKIGIDVSTHNKQIDWQKVKAAGVEFAFIRVGFRGYGKEGRIMLDKQFDWNMSGATVAGIPKGVYFYSQAITYDEGVAEARFVLDNIKDYNLQYPIVLDTEDAENADARTNGLSVEARMQACLGFLETVKNAGYEAMVYANKRWMVLDLDLLQLQDCDWWYAQYNTIPNFPYPFRFWQYSAKGKVPGIAGAVDLNIEFTGDFTETLPLDMPLEPVD